VRTANGSANTNVQTRGRPGTVRLQYILWQLEASKALSRTVPNKAPRTRRLGRASRWIGPSGSKAVCAPTQSRPGCLREPDISNV